jgi:hypothetical protein
VVGEAFVEPAQHDSFAYRHRTPAECSTQTSRQAVPSVRETGRYPTVLSYSRLSMSSTAAPMGKQSNICLNRTYAVKIDRLPRHADVLSK